MDLSFIDAVPTKPKSRKQIRALLAKTFQRTITRTPGDRIISYSQLSNYQKCPRAWELKSYRKLSTDEPSIHLVFGTALHNTIQEWIQLCYSESIQAASKINWDTKFFNYLKADYEDRVVKHGEHFVDKDEMIEFFLDGKKILEYLFKHRTDLFSTKHYELVACELPLYIPPVPGRPKIKLMSYLDIVFCDIRDMSYLIVDLKTSTRGWKDYDKKDKIKTGQLVLYKKYFSQQYNIPEDKVDIEFVILKRKLYEDSLFAQKRIQKFKPPAGPKITKQVVNALEDFVQRAFNEDGSHIDKTHPSVGGPAFSNCKFCEFKERYDLCPKETRITV
jgi:hypothetical protein